MKRSRKSLLGSAAAAFGATSFLRYPAGAAEFTYRFGIQVPVSHPFYIHVSETTKKIESDSNGRLQIQLFPNNALGNDVSMLSQIRVGAIQLFSPTGTVLGTVIPVAAMEGVAFAFPSLRRAVDVLDGRFGTYIRDSIRKAGMYTFDRVWASGFHHVMNSVRPLNSADDTRGLKIGCPPSPIEPGALKALGSAPTPINLAELYSSLQTHVVDGAAISLAGINAGRFYEVQKYLSLTQHIFVAFTIIGNLDAMQKLPKDLRDIMDKNFNEGAVKHGTDTIASEDGLQKALQAKGMVVNAVDTASFRTAIQKAGLYSQWKSQFGDQAWSLLEQGVGRLA